MALGNLRDRACTWVVCFVTVLVIASIFVKKTEWSEISLRRPLSPLLSQNRLRVYGGAGEFRANRGKKLNVLVCAKRQGDALGVRALTSMGDILELKAGDWVQYQSNTYDKWLMAKILDLNHDGSVKLDIKDNADLSRVRALIQVSPGDHVQYDSPTFGEWMDAHVKEVLPNGLVSLDIRDDADPSRIFVPLDVHPSMIRQKVEPGQLKGGGYINTPEDSATDLDGIDVAEPMDSD
ncbi:hypothetical protein AAMO2058_000621000 [Amorphochlora amoebiformis]